MVNRTVIFNPMKGNTRDKNNSKWPSLTENVSYMNPFKYAVVSNRKVHLSIKGYLALYVYTSALDKREDLVIIRDFLLILRKNICFDP